FREISDDRVVPGTAPDSRVLADWNLHLREPNTARICALRDHPQAAVQQHRLQAGGHLSPGPGLDIAGRAKTTAGARRIQRTDELQHQPASQAECRDSADGRGQGSALSQLSVPRGAGMGDGLYREASTGSR